MPRAVLKPIADLPTKSAKIRALGHEGWSRSDIAEALGIRYQHVRNVLVQDEEKRQAGSGVRLGSTGRAAPEPARTTVGPGGRSVIPAAIRAALAMEEGAEVSLRVVGEELRIVTPAAAMRRVRDLVRAATADTPSMADELIAERRQEAAGQASEK